MQKTLGTNIVIPSSTTSAIPIVNPTSNGETKVVLKPPTKVVPSNGNNKPLCRNIIIHGFCKYEGKGCEFNHDSNKPVSTPTSPDKNEPRSTSVLQPVPVESINAPEFVPRFTTDNQGSPKNDKLMSITNEFSQFNINHKQTMSPPQIMMDPYYINPFPRQPLQHHLYAQPLPHNSNISPNQRTIHDFFISNDIRQQMTERNETQLMTAPAHELGLPSEVHVYHSLYPLEPQNTSSLYYGYPSTVYKATSSVDGRQYALVRIEGYRLVDEMSMQVVEAWRRLRHCNIISIREAFTTRAFGDSSLVFVYDYHPCSTTLYTSYCTQVSTHLPENVIWSYITQLASALKAVHGSGLAARNIDLRKILLTGKHRIRLSGSAILDVLQFDEFNVAKQQQQDFIMFGQLIKTLGSFLEHESPDLNSLVAYLEDKSTAKFIDRVIMMIGPRILNEINASQYYNDQLEHEMMKELENGRLVRLLCKIGFINERPEFDRDPSWSETGDRYLIKLFRDYVFHQVDEKGKPVIDMAHVISCLNKLDAGVEEKIMLMSRDEQSCLIVSYKEIKNCINSAFNDLTSGRK